MAVLDILIPTYDNPQYLTPLLNSIFKLGAVQAGFAKLYIINNGKQDLKSQLAHLPNTKVITPEKNVGWEGGCALGMEESSSEFVCFQNDDTFIPKTSYLLYEKMLIPFADRNVAAVAPATTTASGVQSIFHPNSPYFDTAVRWLIFCCVTLRRKDVEAVGGVDTTLPGGDDLDMSIRLRQAGKKLIVTPDAFLIHHGFKTGTRLHGDGYAGVPNGWNSQQMIERTNMHLIRKHGFKTWTETIINPQIISHEVHPGSVAPDCEGDLVRSMLNGDKPVVELGCGAQKTVPHALGVDRVPKGQQVPILHGPSGLSAADVVCDVTGPLPFEDGEFQAIVARHIIEHCVDLVATLKEWNRVLAFGGKLILATPDEDIVNGIPLDPTHCHAFNKESLNKFLSLVGFESISVQSSGNGISFVGCFRKVANA